ncbi:MAG: hypothetical protein ACJ8FY_09355 [Gemmataceae bacterium]
MLAKRVYHEEWRVCRKDLARSRNGRTIHLIAVLDDAHVAEEGRTINRNCVPGAATGW